MKAASIKNHHNLDSSGTLNNTTVDIIKPGALKSRIVFNNHIFAFNRSTFLFIFPPQTSESASDLSGEAEVYKDLGRPLNRIILFQKIVWSLFLLYDKIIDYGNNDAKKDCA